MSSAPLIADVTVDGRRAQGRRGAEQAGVAVRVRSRHRRADLADRREAGAEGGRAGRMVFADAAASAGGADVRAQRAAFPDDLIDFTPELRAQAEKQIERYRSNDVVYKPPMVGNVNGLLGAINDGHRQRRHELAGRRLRSRDAHRVRAWRRPRRLPPNRWRRRRRDSPICRTRRASSGRSSASGSRRAPGTYADAQPQRGRGGRVAAAPGRGGTRRRRRRRPARRRRAPPRRPERAAAAARRRWRRRRRAAHGPGAVDPEAAIRRARGDRSRQGRDQVARAARRDARRGAQSPAAERA